MWRDPAGVEPRTREGVGRPHVGSLEKLAMEGDEMCRLGRPDEFMPSDPRAPANNRPPARSALKTNRARPVGAAGTGWWAQAAALTRRSRSVGPVDVEPEEDLLKARAAVWAGRL